MYFSSKKIFETIFFVLIFFITEISKSTYPQIPKMLSSSKQSQIQSPRKWLIFFASQRQLSSKPGTELARGGELPDSWIWNRYVQNLSQNTIRLVGTELCRYNPAQSIERVQTSTAAPVHISAALEASSRPQLYIVVGSKVGARMAKILQYLLLFFCRALTFIFFNQLNSLRYFPPCFRLVHNKGGNSFNSGPQKSIP